MVEKPKLVLMEVEPVGDLSLLTPTALVSSSVKWAEDNQPSSAVESIQEAHEELSRRSWVECVLPTPTPIPM